MDDTKTVSSETTKTKSESDSEEKSGRLPDEVVTDDDSKCPDQQGVQKMDLETQNRLRAFLEVAGVKLSHVDTSTFQDPEILRKLTNCVSNALDEAALALNKMRSKQQTTDITSDQNNTNDNENQHQNITASEQQLDNSTSNVSNIHTLQQLLGQAGHGINETTEDGESLLSLACSAGYFELAEVLLRMRASVEDRGIKGDSTPLMEAASGGYADIVKLLIDHGAKVNATSSVGNTALTYACCGGFEDVVKILLENSAFVEHQNENGHTPLMEASSCGHVGVAKLLLDYGANINTHSNEFKESALTLACYKGHLEMVQFLLDAGADQEHKTDEMHTALMESCMDGHVEVARLLLDHGAQVNMPVDSFESPLTLAACGGHYELAALLLSRGADLEEVNDEGYTPLMEAAREGHEDVVQLLVEHGANVNIQTEETQETALTLACCGGFLEVAQYLVDHGANIELGASTPLMEASQEGHIDIVKYLISKNAKIDAVTNTMDSALTYACANGHTVIADLLISCGANVEHESEGGRTPLMKSVRAGHLETAKLLISKGADCNRCTTNNDHTVLSLACSGGHLNVVEYLLMKGADSAHILKDNSTMIIEAARGGHTGVVNLLLQQPRFTEALRNQMLAQRQATPTSVSDQQIKNAAAVKRKSRTQPDLAKQHKQLRPNNSDPALPPTQPNWPLYYNPQLMGGVRSFQFQNQMYAPPPGAHSGIQHSMSLPGSPMKSFPPYVYQPHPQFIPSPSQIATTESEKEKISDSVHFSVPPSSEPNDNPVVGGAPPVSVSSQQPCVVNPVGGNYLLSSVFAESNVYSNQDRMEAYLKADEILRNHMSQLDYSKQQALMSALESLMLQSEAHRATIGSTNNDTICTNDIDSIPPSKPVASDTPPTSSSSSTPWSFTDPSQMPKFAIGVSTLATTSGNTSNSLLLDKSRSAGNSPLKQNNTIPDVSVHKPNLISDVGGDENVTQISITPQDSSTSNYEVPTSINFHSRVTPPPPTNQFQPHLPINHGQFFQPIYTPPDLGGGAFNHLMHVQPNPPYDNQPHPLPTSFLLDTSFPMDIPPPTDLIPPHLHHVVIPSTENEIIDKDDNENELDNNESTYYVPSSYEPVIDLDQHTDSNHDTALTLATAGGHDELVELLLARGANIEHRDKKGCTPLILAANAGHAVTVAILLDHDADIEAQTDRTKDTALSLACSSGRQEVVELLLAKGANYEHRNVSDYTPLSLAASGGYVNIIKLLLKAGADINSRTGSKLGISPLMLAAMNGHTSTVKLLLDFGSDINAQIETNRNTALTLACFQGRHEVVNLLVERQANVEHRAKTGLTPLMEAASGGYHEVGYVLISKGADVNAAPVPSSKDTALTIAADKGHYKFVELLLREGAQVDVKNKKGNSPLWLASNGGHLDVVKLLVENNANVDTQDNRKVCGLMAAFRKGHYKVVKFLVEHVTQFPSDADLNRYINTLSDKDLIKKCQRCMEVIIQAKERQAAEANKNAFILLQQLDQEKQHEENKKAAAARKRARKKKQKEKKQALKALEKTSKDEMEDIGVDPEVGGDVGVIAGGELIDGEDDEPVNDTEEQAPPAKPHPQEDMTVEPARKENNVPNFDIISNDMPSTNNSIVTKQHKPALLPTPLTKPLSYIPCTPSVSTATTTSLSSSWPRISDEAIPTSLSLPSMKGGVVSPRKGKKDEGWKEVSKRYNITKKMSVPTFKFSQIVGRNSNKLALIRNACTAQIEVEKSKRQAPMRVFVIKGTHESVKQAVHYITTLQKDPNIDLSQLITTKRSLKTEPTLPLAPQIFNDDVTWPVPGDIRNIKPNYDIVSNKSISTSLSKPQATKVNGTTTNKQQQTVVSMDSSNIAVSTVSTASTTSVRSGVVRQLFVTTTANTSIVYSTSNSITSKPKPPTNNTSIGLHHPHQPIDAAPGRNTSILNSNNRTSSSLINKPSVTEATPVVLTNKITSNAMTSSSKSETEQQKTTQNVCEQIMKTPLIFHDHPSHIAQPKKYSDAVGKKTSVDQQTGNKPLAVGGVAPPNSGSGQVKLNLAPGTRPVINDTSTKPSTSNERSRTSPWYDSFHPSHTPTDNDSSFKEPAATVSPNFLGPIGPPPRHSKAPPPLSPIAQQNSPPVQISPVPKSPLIIQQSNVGLLPIPVDKSAVSFRPIQPEITHVQNIVPTKVPTPIRNNRPPLLATPPGFPSAQLLTGGFGGHSRSPISKNKKSVSPYQGGVSPDSPDKTSPNKIKPAQSSNFNPNAPSFVPMAALGTNITNVTSTSSNSILGQPPPPFNYPLSLPIGSSLLGNVPSTIASGHVISSPVVINSAHPPPPPAPPHPQPPPPPTVPPPIIGSHQSSLLGNPPFHLPVLVPPTRGGNPMYFRPQFDSPGPPPPHMIPSNQFPPHPVAPGGPPVVAPPPPPTAGIVSREQMQEQFVGGPMISAETPPIPPPNSIFGFSYVDNTELSDSTGTVSTELWNHFGNLTNNVTNDISIDQSSRRRNILPLISTYSSVSSCTSAFSPVTSTTAPVSVPSTEQEIYTEQEGPLLRLFTDTTTSNISLTGPGSIIATGSNVWSYSPNIGGSDESGWTKDISHDYTGDWPSLPPDASISSSVSILNSVPSSLINSTFAEVTTATTSQSSGDDLISLLEKLGLEKYQEHFQKNEIDHRALLLMSDKDFAEVGIPKGPRVKLLNAIGRKDTTEADSDCDNVLDYITDSNESTTNQNNTS